MSDKLKTFIDKNKQKFDSAEPSGDAWKKIDARLETKNTNWIKSNGFSKYLYLGFGVSILLVIIYLASQNWNTTSIKTLTQNTGDSALNNSGVWVKTNQNNSEGDATKTAISNSTSDKAAVKNPSTGNSIEEGSTALVQNSTKSIKKDSLIVNASEINIAEQGKIKHEDTINSSVVKEERLIVSNEKKESGLIKNKRKRIYIPEEPVKTNSYSSTLYDNSSLCAVVQAYKFPGKVSMDDGGNYTSRSIMKTISCNRLRDMENVKAVWLKGKIAKKLNLSLTEGFKNIVLQKSDGSKISPVAISHYYSGLGVISGYTGKHFEMIFKDKVELILFFKDAEEGDKIVIDGIIETIIKAQP